MCPFNTTQRLGRYANSPFRRLGFPKCRTPQLRHRHTMCATSTRTSWNFGDKGNGGKHEALSVYLPWVTKSSIYNPGVVCFLPASMKLWQSNQFACQKSIVKSQTLFYVSFGDKDGILTEIWLSGRGKDKGSLWAGLEDLSPWVSAANTVTQVVKEMKE